MTSLVPKLGIVIQNDSGKEIPPRSIVVVTSVEYVAGGVGQETVAVHHANQYSGQNGNIFVTGMTSISSQSGTPGAYLGGRSLGMAFSDQFIYVALDPSSPSPASGDQWGPVSGSWTIGPNRSGFILQGYADDGGTLKNAMCFRTPFDNRRYWAKITTALTSGAFGCPTTCSANVWSINESGSQGSSSPGSASQTLLPFAVSLNTSLLNLKVVNRDANLTANPGDIVKIEWDQVNREWSIYWKGKDQACSSSSDSTASTSSTSVSGTSSSSQPCGCVTVVTSVSCLNGNLYVGYGQARGCC